MEGSLAKQHEASNGKVSDTRRRAVPNCMVDQRSGSTSSINKLLQSFVDVAHTNDFFEVSED